MRLKVGLTAGFIFFSAGFSPNAAHASCAINPDGRTYIASPFDSSVPILSRPGVAGGRVLASVKNGLWSDAATWGGQTPAAGDVVSVSHDVTYDMGSASVLDIVVENGGKLDFDTSKNLQLFVKTIQVMCDGTFESNQASLAVVFRDLPIDTAKDPGRYSNGFIASGKVRILGASKNTPFERIAGEAKIGNTSINLVRPVIGWKAGDRIAIPDTRLVEIKYPNDDLGTPQFTKARRKVDQTEVRTITNVSGNQISFAPALQFDHLCARDGDEMTMTTLPNSDPVCAHAANLSASVVFRSENPGDKNTRAQFIAFNQADVDVQYAGFQDMGRTTTDDYDDATNPASRNAVNFRGLCGPANPSLSHQFRFLGNVIEETGRQPANTFPRFGIELLNSHYGLVKDNVVFRSVGASVGFAGRAESNNVVDHNFSIGSLESSANADRYGLGVEGAGFWIHSAANELRNNVVAAAYAGYQLFVTGYPDLDGNDLLPVPLFKGADTLNPGQFSLIRTRDLPFGQFKDNEAYGIMDRAFGANEGKSLPAMPLLTGTVLWNVGVAFHFDYTPCAIDGAIARNNGGKSTAINYNHPASQSIYKNLDVQGFAMGINFNGSINMSLENSLFRNQQNLYLTNTQTGFNDRFAVFKNVRFLPMPGFPLSAYHMPYYYDGYNSVENQIQHYMHKSVLIVQSHQGNPSKNFRLYYDGQFPDELYPKIVWDSGPVNGVFMTCPEGDLVGAVPRHSLTNQECWNKYQKAAQGEVAPCTSDDMDEITGGGVGCSINPDSTPPVMSNIAATALSPTRVRVSWGAANDPESGVRYYKVYRGSQYIGDSFALTYDDLTVQEGRPYSYQVSAVNFWEMESAKSNTANITTPADREAPRISNVQARGVPPNVLISFDEPINQQDAETKSNYSIVDVTVLSAKLGDTGRVVTLVTSPLIQDRVYSLSVKNIRDRANEPNTMADAAVNFTYSQFTPGNQAPKVNAGPDQIVSGPASLAGVVTDDGLPNPPGAFTVRWTKESGFGTVKFSNDQALITQATFSQPGTYVLVLTATDEELSTSDKVTIIVQAASGQSDGDVKSDYLMPSIGKKEIFIPGCSDAALYDRDGDKVLSFTGPSVRWNGTLRSGRLAAGNTYFFRCKEGKSGKIVVVP